MNFRKITCDSEEFNNAAIFIKTSVLSKNNMPKLIVGTGLSAACGVPGMWKLSEELKTQLGTHKDDEIRMAWAKKEKDISDNGLEEKQEEVKVCEAYTNNNGGIMEEREVFTKNTEFVIYPISDEDRSNYTELHKQLNGEKSLYLNPRLKDMMWEQTLNGTDRIFSLYTVQGDYCGSVELQKPDSRTPEIGIDLLESRRNMGIALKAVPLFAKKIYEIKDMDYFIIRISSNNAHSKHVFEKMGAVKIGEEETDFQKFAERFGTTIEKKGQDLEQYRNLFDESDDETVYRYKLEPEVLLQY